MYTTNISDALWEEIESKLKFKTAWRGKSEEKRLFVEAVLYLLSQKNKYSTRMNWKELKYSGYDNDESYARKFNRWKDNGTWQVVLSVLSKYSEYEWIFKFGVYEVFFDNPRFLCDVNRMIERPLKHELEGLKKENKEYQKKDEEYLKVDLLKKEINYLREQNANLATKIKRYTTNMSD